MAETNPLPFLDYATAARQFATPAVITQWTEKGKVRRQVQCLRVGQLALSESMLFVLEGEKILGWVYLADVRSLGIESRRSYRHPFIGAAIGLAMVTAPIAVIAHDPNNIGRSFGGDFFLIWGPLLVALGAFTFYEAVLSRKRPWLIVQTQTTPQAFMFSNPLTSSESALVEALAAVASTNAS
jgi:hypothetical protein